MSLFQCFLLDSAVIIGTDLLVKLESKGYKSRKVHKLGVRIIWDQFRALLRHLMRMRSWAGVLTSTSFNFPLHELKTKYKPQWFMRIKYDLCLEENPMHSVELLIIFIMESTLLM